MSNILDNLVDQLGGYDELSADERATYRDHLKIMESKPVTVDATKVFVRKMITLLERGLVDTKENSRESKNLKARLKNFLVLEAFLFSPEKAKEALEQYYKER